RRRYGPSVAPRRAPCRAAGSPRPSTVRGSSARARHRPRTLAPRLPFYQATAELVSPPAALALHVFARILAAIRRAAAEHLEAVRTGLVAPTGSRRDAHSVPLPELDDLVVEFHPAAPAHDDVHLLLRLVCMAVRKATAGWDSLMGQAGL